MKVRRLFSLRPGDATQAVTAYVYLARATWVVFVRRDARRVTAAGRRDAVARPQGRTAAASRFDYRRAALWTNRAARFPFPWARCLQRSVALSMWMRRNGLAPELKFGVRKTGDGIDAHSWVEFDGRVINDSPNVRVLFATLSAAVPRTAGPKKGQAG
jgi:hypothetical protein